MQSQANVIEAIKVGKMFAPLKTAQSAAGKIPESLMGRERSGDRTRGEHGTRQELEVTALISVSPQTNGFF